MYNLGPTIVTILYYAVRYTSVHNHNVQNPKVRPNDHFTTLMPMSADN